MVVRMACSGNIQTQASYIAEPRLTIAGSIQLKVPPGKQVAITGGKRLTRSAAANMQGTTTAFA